MPAIEREFDQRGRITIPQDYIRNWGVKVVIHPNYCSAVIRPKNVSLEDAVNSVEILLADMYHQLELQKKGRGRIARCGECGSIKWVSEEPKEEKK